MRILHLDTDDIDNPLSGGGSIRNYEIYRRLSSRHEITVLTASFPGSVREITRDGVRYIRLGRGTERLGLSYHASYLALLPSAIGQIPHDLLVEDFMPPCGGTASFLWTRKPVIASIQWLFARAWAKKYKLPFHHLERFFIRRYRRFIVLSPHFRDEIRRVNPGARVEVVPMGTEEEFLSAPVREGEYILFLGRVDLEQKGLDMLLRSYRQSRRHHPYRLVIVGDGFDMARMKKMVGDLGLTDWVEMVGKISAPHEKARWFTRARIVCMPSRFETFGIVALEALAFGKPVLCFDIAPLNEIVTPERGGLVPAFDEEAYGRKMTAMLNDGEFLERAERSGREFAKGFTWEGMARRQNDFYEEVLRHG